MVTQTAINGGPEKHFYDEFVIIGNDYHQQQTQTFSSQAHRTTAATSAGYQTSQVLPSAQASEIEEELKSAPK